MKTISMPVYNRPQYLARVLDSLKAQPEIRDYTLVFSLESECWPCRELIEDIEWAPVDVSENKVRRGLTMNTFLSIDTAFRLGSEFNIYLEDDFILSPDALALAEAYRVHPVSQTSFMLAFRRINEDKTLPAVVRRTGRSDGLMGCGFCCRPEAMAHLKNWWFHRDIRMGGQEWDWSIGWMVDHLALPVWRPMVNRTQHIGVTGENTRPETFENPGLNGPCYQGRETKFIFEE